MIINTKNKRLSELKPGQSGRIIGVSDSESISQRLMEMGLIEGTVVDLVRFAPLGDPMEVVLHGYHLSLRKSEANLVEVEVV